MPEQQLWHVNPYEVYQQFTSVNHIGQPGSLTPLLLGVSEQSSRDDCPPDTSGGYVVREASHPAVTGDACSPRLLLVVQQVHFFPFSREMNNDIPSFRSFIPKRFPARRSGKSKRHPTLSAEMKPLTGRNPTVIGLLHRERTTRRQTARLHLHGFEAMRR